jgi:anti-sigma B factor antagonist
MRDPQLEVITLSGSLDVAAERRLRSDVSEAVGDRSRGFVIDLRGVTFMDSSALAVLVHGDRQLRRQGRALACVVRQGPVEQLLEATGLRHGLAVFETPEDAAAHVLRTNSADASDR